MRTGSTPVREIPELILTLSSDSRQSRQGCGFDSCVGFNRKDEMSSVNLVPIREVSQHVDGKECQCNPIVVGETFIIHSAHDENGAKLWVNTKHITAV